MSIMIMIKTC